MPTRRVAVRDPRRTSTPSSTARRPSRSRSCSRSRSSRPAAGSSCPIVRASAWCWTRASWRACGWTQRRLIARSGEQDATRSDCVEPADPRRRPGVRRRSRGGSRSAGASDPGTWRHRGSWPDRRRRGRRRRPTAIRPRSVRPARSAGAEVAICDRSFERQQPGLADVAPEEPRVAAERSRVRPAGARRPVGIHRQAVGPDRGQPVAEHRAEVVLGPAVGDHRTRLSLRAISSSAVSSGSIDQASATASTVSPSVSSRPGSDDATSISSQPKNRLVSPVLTDRRVARPDCPGARRSRPVRRPAPTSGSSCDRLALPAMYG